MPGLRLASSCLFHCLRNITSQSMPYMYYNITSFEWCGFARTQIRMHVMRHRHRRRHVDTTTTRALQLLRFSLSVCFTVFERKLKANKNQICNSHIPLVRSRMIQTNTCCIDDGPSSVARSTQNTITRSRTNELDAWQN